jgi:hypothetical protein
MEQGSDMPTAKQPNIVVFFWDNFGWGELGCYGGGVLRGAPTPRIDKLADDGLRLLNFNVEPQPVGDLDWPAPDSVGHAFCAARWWRRWHDPVGGHDRPRAVGCGLCDWDVGQVAPGQRPGAAQPG